MICVYREGNMYPDWPAAATTMGCPGQEVGILTDWGKNEGEQRT